MVHTPLVLPVSNIDISSVHHNSIDVAVAGATDIVSPHRRTREHKSIWGCLVGMSVNLSNGVGRWITKIHLTHGADHNRADPNCTVWTIEKVRTPLPPVRLRSIEDLAGELHECRVILENPDVRTWNFGTVKPVDSLPTRPVTPRARFVWVARASSTAGKGQALETTPADRRLCASVGRRRATSTASASSGPRGGIGGGSSPLPLQYGPVSWMSSSHPFALIGGREYVEGLAASAAGASRRANWGSVGLSEHAASAAPSRSGENRVQRKRGATGRVRIRTSGRGAARPGRRGRAAMKSRGHGVISDATAE